jgi:hypothetical protein
MTYLTTLGFPAAGIYYLVTVVMQRQCISGTSADTLSGTNSPFLCFPLPTFLRAAEIQNTNKILQFKFARSEDFRSYPKQIWPPCA